MKNIGVLLVLLLFSFMAKSQGLAFYDLLSMRIDGVQAVENMMISKGWYLKSTQNNAAEMYSDLLFGFGKKENPSPAWFTYRYGEEYPVSVVYQTVIKKHFDDILNRILADGLKAIKNETKGNVQVTDYESGSFVARTIIVSSPLADKTEYIVKIYSKDEYNIVLMKEAIEAPK